MSDDDDVMLNPQPCCWCGETRVCRNIILLPRLAPVPGTGWSCLFCGLPEDGAIAVGCDECMADGAHERTPTWVCSGWAAPTDGVAAERVRYEDLPDTVFEHRLGFHEEDAS
jgi:hypothetical protein